MMPLLPTADLIACNLGDAAHFWDIKSVIEYGQQCREAALEEAAALCDGERWASQTGAHSIRFIDTYNGACDDCAQVIRRLK